jgi:predicted ATPase
MELIGRQREQLDLIERLKARRLVTVIGPAGIGKTAVARAVAERIGSDYQHGAHFVDLTRIESPDAVAGAFAAQLGFSSFDAILSSPSDESVLVLLDNCEHVTAAAGDAVAELLAACGGPTILATSRSPLGLPDESLVVVGPLRVPARGSTDVDAEAVQLFLERARDAGAAVPDDQLETVALLCRHLDGVPLAIELAAARTRMLQPAEILARLAEGVDVLVRPQFRGDERHRSLTGTIDWSYRLLPDDLAAVFARLGLFSGPFTAGLAEAVAADAGLAGADAADALHRLVDSSLVVVEPGPGTTHYRLLETVRTFAAQRLAEQGALDEARARLAEHVAAAAVQLLTEGGSRWDRTIFTRLLALYDTIVSTMRWCLANDDDPTRSLMLCSVLWGVVHQGHSDEIATLAEATLERWPDLSVPFAADAAATAATARCLLGDPRGAIDLARRALETADASRTAPVTLRRAMAYSARVLHDWSEALRLFAEVSLVARERGLLALALEAEVSQSQLLADRGDLDAAVELVTKVRQEASAAGSQVNEVWAETVLAHLRLRQDIATGMPLVLEALAASRRIDYPAAISVNLRSIAWASLRTGDNRRAAEALAELFDGLLARSGVADVRGALYTTAEVLRAAGRDAWEPLAATAEALPLVGLTGAAIDNAVQLPTHGVAALARRDGILLARAELRRLLDEQPEPASEVVTSMPAARARFVDRGEFWEIEFAGCEIHAKASKGMSDLHRLLSAPGREVHCLELIGAAVEEASTGEVIDDAARREYEQRIRDLQADVDAAVADNDLARAERAEAELDTLVEHLSSALGLGGRSRRGGGSAERARSAVTQRVRSTIRKLRDDLPELGRHLEASVSTGTFCVYRPEHPVEWQL